MIAWGDFSGDRNKTVGKGLLKHQKRFASLVSSGRRNKKEHSDPLFFKSGIMKIDDLYRQQLRVHAWHFWNGQLPEAQAEMFHRVRDVHSYNTRASESEVSVSVRDQGSISFKLPKEWATIPENLKQTKSLAAFKRNSKKDLRADYGKFQCLVQGCGVCGEGSEVAQTL